MRQITKGSEPPSLIEHRKTPYCDYANYDPKDELRDVLVEEQRSLCCYCMSRIRSGSLTMKIEHWHCQDRYEGEQLVYRNLLGACRGGEGLPPKYQHCDTRKGYRDIRWNPADPDHHIETRLRYDADGTVRSDEPEFDKQLNEVLNLNLPLLCNNREAAGEAVAQWWKAERTKLRGPVPRARLERELVRHIGGAGDLLPFSPVAAWWLRQKLAVMPA